MPQPQPIQTAYQSLLDSGRLLPDTAQAETVRQLAAVQHTWAQTGQKGRGIFRLLGKSAAVDTVQGLYLWGDVGRGKSLLMDLFYDTIDLAPKQRIHYHAFMMDIHARIHQWREANRSTAAKDPLPAIAATLASELRLLCLDELQVTDIADAMILGRLFELLFAQGVRVVFTSNRQPEALYLNGLQRERFLPFIRLVRERLQVIELLSAEDYRLRQLRAVQTVYIVAAPDEARRQMDAVFRSLIREPAQSRDIDVQGHVLHVPLASGDVARFDFADLCAKALGAADYAAIAQHYGTVMMDNIPQLSPAKRNEAKRFVTFIDTLYENRTKLVCSATVPPQQLYPEGDGSFEFERTVSRLMEMQSEKYLAASHEVA